ncbi:hypothetical protein [Ruminococcus callidus]|nr:hypothetical protein [Ruminococcus callidus]
MALKGYTKIELTDVETNNTEVYEKHNIVTNALSEIFRPIGYWTSSDIFLSGSDPLVKKYCGGLLCFDKTIPEDKNTLFAPAGTTLTACGVYNTLNSGTNKVRGDCNLLETSISSTTKTAKFVYDFKTSQGNGTISSVCLTSQNGGYGFFNNSDTSGTNTSYGSLFYNIGTVFPRFDKDSAYVGSSECTFYADLTSDVSYSIKATSPSSIQIIVRKLYASSISIFDSNLNNSYSSSPTAMKTLNISFPNSYIYKWFDPESETLWLYCNKSRDSSTLRSGDTLQIYNVDIHTCEIIKSYEVKNPFNSNISLVTGCIYLGRFYAFDLVAKTYYARRVCWFKLDDNAINGEAYDTIEQINTYILYPRIIKSGKIYYVLESSVSDYHNAVFDTELNKLCAVETYSTMSSKPIPISKCKLGYLAGDPNINGKSYYNILSNYLATINNLETPITKTSDKTMKITYTLKEVDS